MGSLIKFIMRFSIHVKIKKYVIIIVGSQIVAHTQMETGDGPNKPNIINL